MDNVIGLIPAGGHARRISPLPCSKELYPVGFWRSPGEKDGRPKVVCHYLLEKLSAAGVTKAYIILRDGKWDIPAYFRDGSSLGMHIGYLMLGLPYGVPYTLDQAYPFVRDAVVAFGFPDILFEPHDAFARLLARMKAANADVVLGLFPIESAQTGHRVDIGSGGRVRQILIRPQQTQLPLTWAIAVWTNVFTSFMHEHLATLKPSAPSLPELSMSEVIESAILGGLKIVALPVSESPFLDIGMPENLIKAHRGITLSG
jgi:glucose-1-phosphate thymidylyltransferase